MSNFKKYIASRYGGVLNHSKTESSVSEHLELVNIDLVHLILNTWCQKQRLGSPMSTESVY